MEEYIRILDLASRNALPEQICEDSELPIGVVRELIEAGYISAIDASSNSGDAYLNPRITLSGREYIGKLRRDRSAALEKKIQGESVKLFISWSGKLSHQIAVHLKEWLPVVLPFIDPWVSSEDIRKGTRWGTELATQLEGTDAGVVCLVPGNLNEPWLNFEAGSLSKSVQKASVHPYLIGYRPWRVNHRTAGAVSSHAFHQE